MYLGLDEASGGGPGVTTAALVRAGITKSQFQRKRDKITEEVLRGMNNLTRIRHLAITKAGLLSNDLRVYAWPKLLKIDPINYVALSDSDVRGSKDYQQVEIDVRRSVRRFPVGIRDKDRDKIKDKLVRIIVTVLNKNPELCYYQGFHDVAVTFLLVGGESFSVSMMDRLSSTHLKDYMSPTMEKTAEILDLLFPLVGLVHPKLKQHLERGCVGSLFALSWVITWFAHVIVDVVVIARLFDFFIACHPLMPLYLSGSIVLHRCPDLLRTRADMAELHAVISHLPVDLPWESLLHQAAQLFLRFPPSDLISHSQVSKGEDWTDGWAVQDLQSDRGLLELDSVGNDVDSIGTDDSSGNHVDVGLRGCPSDIRQRICREDSSRRLFRVAADVHFPEDRHDDDFAGNAFANPSARRHLVPPAYSALTSWLSSSLSSGLASIKSLSSIFPAYPSLAVQNYAFLITMFFLFLVFVTQALLLS